VVALRPPLSETLTVMSALPVLDLVGRMVTVRFAPNPPKLTFPAGMRFGFDEVALIVRPFTEESTSPTRMEIGPADPFSRTV